jgi:transposase
LQSLNDSALARGLDRLFDVGGESVFSTLSLRVIAHEGLSLSQLQADTTSRLVFGEYKNPEDGAVSITYGHSKDYRPDLKQVMVGVATTVDGIPVVAQMLDGNTSDKKWHGGMLDIVQQRLQVPKDKKLHYVGDSALITQENLDLAARLSISVTGRLPRTVNACSDAVTEALSRPERMEELGIFSPNSKAASYRGCVLQREVLGHNVQLGVYMSNGHDERVTKNVTRRQKRAQEKAEKAAKKLMRKSFACADDAKATGQEFTREFQDPLSRILCEVVCESHEKPLKRGRPRADTPRETYNTYRLVLSIEPDFLAIQ